MHYSFTSVEGLRNLSKKIADAVSKLESSIDNLERDATKLKNAANNLNHIDGAYSRPNLISTVKGDYQYFYAMKWKITGQESAYKHASRVLEELNDVKANLEEQFQKVSKQVANIGEEIASDEDAIEALLGNIAYNKYDAAGHNFISKDKFANTKQYWTDGKLEFADNINGQSLGKDVRVIIKNGVYMGFTTVAAMNAYNNAKSGSSGAAGGPYTASPRIVTNKDIKTKEEEKADVYRSIKENQASSHDRSATTTTKPSSKKSAKAGKYQGTNKTIETDANAKKKVNEVRENIAQKTNAYRRTGHRRGYDTMNEANAYTKTENTNGISTGLSKYLKSHDNNLSIKNDKNSGYSGDFGQTTTYHNVKLKKSTLPRSINIKDDNGSREIYSNTYFTDANHKMHWVFEDKTTGDLYMGHNTAGSGKYSKLVDPSDKDFPDVSTSILF